MLSRPNPSEAANRPEAASPGVAPTAVRPARMMVNELAKPTKAARMPADAGWTSEASASGDGADGEAKETPGGGQRQMHVRLKTARKHRPSSQRWLERQLNDPYVAASKREGMRSRAAYKLKEIDDKHRLLKPGAVVVDLGAAPGGWSQIAAERVQSVAGKGQVVAIDYLAMEPLPGVEETVTQTVQGQDVPADPPSIESASTLALELDLQQAKAPTPVADVNAPLCMQCGIQMQRAGSCHACPSCGTTSGCS